MPVGDERHFGIQVWAIPGSCTAFHQGTFLKGIRAEDILADYCEAQVCKVTRLTFWAKFRIVRERQIATKE